VTFLVITGGAAAAVDVTTCGQQVPARDEASLVGDLDCNGGVAVVLGERATLLMNGHAVIGQVGCTGSCTIRGPGDVSGASGVAAGIFLNYGGKRGRVEISQVTVHDNYDGIGDAARKLILTDVVSSNNTNEGILLLRGSIRGTNITTNGNGANGIYLGTGSVRVEQYTAVANGQIGLNHNRGRTMLSGSTLTGNQWTLGTGPLDLFSSTRPRLVDTVCEHSLGVRGPWGVCTGD
jgi:hypothetical protein